MHSVIFLLHTVVSTYKETSVRSFWFSTDCRSLYLPYQCSFSHFFDLDKNVTKFKEEVRKRRQEVLLEQSPWSQSKMLVWSSWLKWVTLVTNSMAVSICLYMCHGRETVEHLWFFSVWAFSPCLTYFRSRAFYLITYWLLWAQVISILCLSICQSDILCVYFVWMLHVAHHQSFSSCRLLLALSVTMDEQHLL